MENAKIYIYTEDFFLWPRTKNFLKKILGRQNRGPKAVERSLVTGLKELGAEFTVNQPLDAGAKAACVLSGVKTLKWAISQKKAGKIKYLATGPNIVVTPLDENALIADPMIDLVLVPSGWNKNWWVSLDLKMADRISVWPAGVKDFGKKRKADGLCLVYKKFCPETLFDKVLDTLNRQNIKYQVIKYGSYNFLDYENMLFQTRFMVFLSESESEGLALIESWMAGVPTLVWDSGIVRYKELIWKEEGVSAPYLAPAAGMFFKSKSDFEENFFVFLNKLESFNPRMYALENFSDKVCANKYINLISPYSP